MTELSGYLPIILVKPRILLPYPSISVTVEFAPPYGMTLMKTSMIGYRNW